MRKTLIALAATIGAAGSPAFADEAYFEVTTGVSWNDEETDAVAGVAIGYDFDLNEQFFVGVEGIAEKLLADDTRVAWGIGGRVGAEVMPASKVFVGLNWQSKDCGECGDAVGLGAGWEQSLSEKLYVKFEYKHLFIGNNEPNANVGIVGLGVTF